MFNYKKIIILFLIDIFLVFFTSWLALSSRLENFYPINEILIKFILINLSILIFFSAVFKTYRIILRNLNSNGILKILKMLFFILISSITIFAFIKIENLPRSMGVVYPIIFSFGILINRIIINYILKNNYFKTNNKISTGVIINEYTTSAFSFLESIEDINVVSIFEFKEKNIGRFIGDTKVERLSDIGNTIKKKKIKKIIILANNIKPQKLQKIINLISRFNIFMKIFDNINDTKNFRLPKVEEILNRKNVIYKKEFSNLKDKEILISGAGGSIGSELSKLVFLNEPKKLILVDNTEINLFNIQKEINKINKNIKTEVKFLLLSVVSKKRIENIFKKSKIDFVFHAAAYKHVEIVQNNMREALINNFLGTSNIAEVSKKYNVKKFINVSTDKAVRPNNFMGLTKLMAEEYLEFLSDNKSLTKYINVRFGNVINSSGSVIPLFVEQINLYNKIFVRNKETTRYFMTISEAVYLILKASQSKLNFSKLILDMGKPIKILDLAIKIIYILGKKQKFQKTGSGVEIEIEQLKPGEKIHEELTTSKKLKYIGKKLIHVEEKRTFKNNEIFKIKKTIEKDVYKLSEKYFKELYSIINRN